jgi:signal transduction histidine kinase
VKHAAGSSATVHVDYGTARLSIEVTDTGGARPSSADAGSGRGLVGLRERLALYGGTLEAGPRIRGGYRLHAVIPLVPAANPDPQEVS